ncbi:MAG: hypothetical protein ACOY5B_06365 [Spirochaetota bacterium]
MQTTIDRNRTNDHTNPKAILGFAATFLVLFFLVAGCAKNNETSNTGSGSTNSAGAGNSEKEITSFIILGQSGTIGSNTIAVTVPYGTNVTNLMPTFTIKGVSVNVGGVSQCCGPIANDFSTPKIYTVVAADGSTRNYTVSVTVAPNTAKALTLFSLTNPKTIGAIDEAGKTIRLVLPFGSATTALTPTFNSTGVSVTVGGVSQVTGTTVNNFASPVTYRVTAADGSTADYTVTAVVATASREWWGVASSADGVKLAAAARFGQIYTSTDRGVTWTARESNREWRLIVSSADGTRLAAYVHNGQIYTSSDSGSTWIARESARAWTGLASSSDGMRLAATVHGGQIYTSSDGGVTWTARESNRSWSTLTSSANGLRIVAGLNSGQTYISSDGGVSWVSGGTLPIYNSTLGAIASSDNGLRLVAVIDGAAFSMLNPIYTSEDGGATWMAGSTYHAYWHSVSSSADGTRLAAGTRLSSDLKVFVSSDSGLSWAPRRGGPGAAVASSADGMNLISGAISDYLYTSNDGGVTWIRRF